jgi:hypothetical protein
VVHCFKGGRPRRSSLKVFLILVFQKPKPSGELGKLTNINRVALKKPEGKMIHYRLRIYPGQEERGTRVPEGMQQDLTNPESAAVW